MQEGYISLLAKNGFKAIHLWEELYNKYPSAELCCYLARANFYQIFILDHDKNHPAYIGHLTNMEKYAFLALKMKDDSSTAHAIASLAICLLISNKNWCKVDSFMIWQARYHAEVAIDIDDNPIAHISLGIWHRNCNKIPDYTSMWMKLRTGYKPVGYLDNSIMHLKKAIELVPKNNIFKAELALTYLSAKIYDEAKIEINNFIVSPIMNFPASDIITSLYHKKLKIRK